MEELAQIVAVSGDDLEHVARDRNKNTRELGFLNDPCSLMYQRYKERVSQIKRGLESQDDVSDDTATNVSEPKKKRRSRWGDKDDSVGPPPTININTDSIGSPGMVMPTALGGNITPVQHKPALTPARAANTSLLAYAQRVFGSLELSEDQWKQCEDQLKVNIFE